MDRVGISSACFYPLTTEESFIKLCEKWEKGEILCDLQSLENLAYQLCYGNVKQIV